MCFLAPGPIPFPKCHTVSMQTFLNSAGGLSTCSSEERRTHEETCFSLYYSSGTCEHGPTEQILWKQYHGTIVASRTFWSHTAGVQATLEGPLQPVLTVRAHGEAVTFLSLGLFVKRGVRLEGPRWPPALPCRAGTSAGFPSPWPSPSSRLISAGGWPWPSVSRTARRRFTPN